MMDKISPTEAAKRLGVTPFTVRRWIHDKKLPATRVGGRWKLDPRDLEKMVTESYASEK